MINVQFYGVLQEVAGSREISTPLADPAPLSDVLQLLQAQLPGLAAHLPRLACAVDDRIVPRSHIISPGATLALLPPVSGGMAELRHLQSEPIDLMALLTETADPGAGALVVFSGTVRNNHDGKSVERLDYSSHPALVERVLGELEQEVIEKFKVLQCRIVHRDGTLEIGEDSVLVVVRAGHRPEAFAAARYAIDTLKKRTPIWKREFYSDGSVDYQDGDQLMADEPDAADKPAT